ncbi:KAP family P-loop NTPase fold protein [Candidatus Nitrospira salsa]
MDLRLADIEIPEDKPFKNDQLGRNREIAQLTQIISTLDQPSVLAIDSSWGTGKTTFLRMWQASIRKEFPCLIYNAWENDFTADPLVSFIGELEKELDLFEISDPKVKRKLKRALGETKKAGGTFLKRALPLMLRVASGGILSVDGKVLDQLTNLTEGLAEDFFKEYEKSKKSISAFKEKLEDFINYLGETKFEGKPFIVFVDELDRCRPPFAIQLLERIKHFFNVKGMVFVLAIDRKQLGESMKVVYGSGMDVAGYLRRFIDIDYKLKQQSGPEFSNYLFQTMGTNSLLSRLRIDEHKNEFLNEFKDLSQLLSLSCREQVHLCSRFNLFLRMTQDDSFHHSSFALVLIAIRVKEEDFYQEIVKGTTSPYDILLKINSLSGREDWRFNLQWGSSLDAFLRSAKYTPAAIREELQRFEKTQKEENYLQKLQENLQLRYQEGVYTTLRKLGSNGKQLFVQLVDKIELIGRFDWND